MTTHSKLRNPIVRAVLLTAAFAILGATPALADRTVDAGEAAVVSDDVYNTITSVTSAATGGSDNSKSGLGDGTNPGQGAGTSNSPNEGTDNPNQSGGNGANK